MNTADSQTPSTIIDGYVIYMSDNNYYLQSEDGKLLFIPTGKISKMAEIIRPLVEDIDDEQVIYKCCQLVTHKDNTQEVFLSRSQSLKSGFIYINNDLIEEFNAQTQKILFANMDIPLYNK